MASDPKAVSEDQKKAVQAALEAKKKADPNAYIDEPKVAASQQATAEQLKFQMAADKTKQGIARRQSKDKLEDAGIIKTPQEDMASKLEKAKAADAINKVHRRRESVEDLKAKGIVKTPNEATADALEKQMIGDKLNKKLADPERPKPEDVQAQMASADSDKK